MDVLETLLPACRGVLFVCSGNVVRSAFAHLYAVHLGCPLAVLSAATTYRNPRLFAETVQALRSRGVSPEAIRSFRPRHVDDLERAPDEPLLVLGMSEEHLRAMVARGWPPARVHLLDSLLRPEAPGPIRDPVLEGADFEATYEHVARAVRALVERARLSSR